MSRRKKKSAIPQYTFSIVARCSCLIACFQIHIKQKTKEVKTVLIFFKDFFVSFGMLSLPTKKKKKRYNYSSFYYVYLVTVKFKSKPLTLSKIIAPVVVVFKIPVMFQFLLESAWTLLVVVLNSVIINQASTQAFPCKPFFYFLQHQEDRF